MAFRFVCAVLALTLVDNSRQVMAQTVDPLAGLEDPLEPSELSDRPVPPGGHPPGYGFPGGAAALPETMQEPGEISRATYFARQRAKAMNGGMAPMAGNPLVSPLGSNIFGSQMGGNPLRSPMTPTGANPAMPPANDFQTMFAEFQRWRAAQGGAAGAPAPAPAQPAYRRAPAPSAARRTPPAAARGGAARSPAAAVDANAAAITANQGPGIANLLAALNGQPSNKMIPKGELQRLLMQSLNNGARQPAGPPAPVRAQQTAQKAPAGNAQARPGNPGAGTVKTAASAGRRQSLPANAPAPAAPRGNANPNNQAAPGKSSVLVIPGRRVNRVAG